MPFLFALALLAPPQAPPDYWSCDAEAFRTIAAIYGTGIGSVTLRAAPDYQPRDVDFTFAVIERVTGRGRFSAHWTLPGRTLDAAAVFSGLRIPLGDVPDRFTATIALDGAPVATRRYRRDGAGIAPEGGPPPLSPDNAITSSTRDPWLPDLRGHRTLAFTLTDADGKSLGVGDTFLLPAWDKQRGAIAAARRAADGLRKMQRCNATYVLGRTG